MRFRFVVYILISLFASVESIQAQTIVNIDMVLETALKDDKVVRESEMERFSSTLDYKLPAIKKVELRLGINGNNSPDSLDGSLRNEDYYSLNVSPNRWKEMKLQKELKPAQTNMYSKEVELLKMQALEERYIFLVNLYYILETNKKRKELLELLNTKNALLQQMLNDGITIKVSDALDTDKDLIQTFGLLQEEESTLSQYNFRLSQYLNSTQSYSVNFSEIIPLKKAIANTQLFAIDSTATSPNLDYKLAQYQFAKANYNLERVQNTNIINNLQLGYNRPVYTSEILKKFKPENTLTFRVGISVPLYANNNLNKSNANMQQYNALLNWKSATTIQGKTTAVQQSKLDNTISQYNALETYYNKSIIIKFLENEKLMAQSTALEIIDLKIAKKKLEINMLGSANNVMQNYILMLEYKGLLKYDLRHQYLLAN